MSNNRAKNEIHLAKNTAKNAHTHFLTKLAIAPSPPTRHEVRYEKIYAVQCKTAVQTPLYLAVEAS